MIGVSTSQPVGFHPMDAEPNPRPPETSNSELPVTLLIKHLPDAIPHSTLSRLFSHYGAFSLRPCSSGRMRNCAFVDFKNEAVAYQAQRQLNGLRFLGKILIVERAFNSTKNEKLDKAESQPEKESLSRTLVTDNSLAKDGSEGLKPRPLPVGEPIAPRLGVDYPFPPHLEYAYPPPDGNILTNIVNALISVPRFYTQVLHLMNKMNIPAPFRMALPTPPLPHILPTSTQPLSAPLPPIDVKTNLSDLSSGESEMASSDEEADGKTILSGVAKVAKSGRKRVRRDAIVGPAVDKEVAHEAVGLKSASLIPKEMPIIKRKNPVLQIKIMPKVTQDELKDDDIRKEPGDSGSKDLGLQPYATSEELKVGKLPPEEILSLPMFKNYAAGNPTPVLYIKNLAKDVVSDDFYYIFGSLFGSIESTKSSLAVKLMQEGRMRGQAFVTFPTVELAHQALDVVNGFMFKGKPMIIQFGRNPAAGKPS